MWYFPLGAGILIIWGILTLRAFFLKKKALSSQIEYDNFLMKTLLGKSHDRVHNLLYGIAEIALGILTLIYYFNN